MCGYEITGAGEFYFHRENGEAFTHDGPTQDNSGSSAKYFAYINSGLEALNNNTSTMEMPMLNAADHMIECFHFWFSIKVV